MFERTTGALLGLACGDALGVVIEFMDSTTVKRRYGRVTEMMASGSSGAGEWTDDTGLALCVARGILEQPDDPVATTGRHFLEWSRQSKDFGATFRAALANFEKSGDWLEASRKTPQALSGRAAGNGSLMRSLPVALAYSDLQRLLTESARLSAMTHWNSQAEVVCAVYCLFVRELLGAAEPRPAWGTALATARRVADAGALAEGTPGPAPLPDGFWQRLENVENLRYEELQPSGYAGHCVECLEAAVWCCLHADSAEQAILDAVNLAGEADTIGAVTGGAAGAIWGVQGLPQRWLEVLRDRREIEALAEPLETLRTGGNP